MEEDNMTPRSSWTALSALSVLALAACGPQATKDADNVANATRNAVANAADATGNALENAGQAISPTPTAQEFINIAAKSDAFEIAAAKLAVVNATSAEVKAFAEMMITAHTQSTEKIKKAASAATPPLTPDAALTDDQNEDLNELRGLKGAKFDEEYIDGQVDAHQDALSLMKKYADDGEVASLKTAAGEIAPVVEEHLDHARKLDKN
jgi:putative membrane protein